MFVMFQKAHVFGSLLNDFVNSLVLPHKIHGGLSAQDTSTGEKCDDKSGKHKQHDSTFNHTSRQSRNKKGRSLSGVVCSSRIGYSARLRSGGKQRAGGCLQ